MDPKWIKLIRTSAEFTHSHKSRQRKRQRPSSSKCKLLVKNYGHCKNYLLCNYEIVQQVYLLTTFCQHFWSCVMFVAFRDVIIEVVYRAIVYISDDGVAYAYYT